MTIQDRRRGWLTNALHSRFRELLLHSGFRHSVACPIYCLMPDHIHLLLVGFDEATDQRLAIRHLRRHLNEELAPLGHRLQKQAYDHVLREEERERDAFQSIAWYIRANPERAGLISRSFDAPEGEVEPESKAARARTHSDDRSRPRRPAPDPDPYSYRGCVVPGYPDLTILAEDYWERFWRAWNSLCSRRGG